MLYIPHRPESPVPFHLSFTSDDMMMTTTTTTTIFLMAAAVMAAPVEPEIPNTSDNPFVKHWHLPLGTVFIIVGAILGAIIVAVVTYHLATCIYYNRKARHEHETFAGHFTDLDQSSADLSLDGYAASLAGRLYRDLMLKRGLMYVSPTLSLKLKGLESMIDLTGLTIIESTTNNTGLNVDQLTVGGYTPTLNRLMPDIAASNFGSQSDTTGNGRPALLFSVNHMAYQGEVLALYGSQYFNNMLKPGRRDSGNALQRLSGDWLMVEPAKPSDSSLLQRTTQSRRHSQVLEDLLAGNTTHSRPPSVVLDDLLTRMADGDDDSR